MADVVDRSDDGDDLVDMHHTLRRSLRRRLKHISAEIERPVTDIVNEAIEAWLERHEDSGDRRAASDLRSLPTAAEKVEYLRQRKADGTFFSAAASLEKSGLVELLAHLGRQADRRASTDRLIALLAERL